MSTKKKELPRRADGIEITDLVEAAGQAYLDEFNEQLARGQQEREQRMKLHLGAIRRWFVLAKIVDQARADTIQVAKVEEGIGPAGPTIAYFVNHDGLTFVFPAENSEQPRHPMLVETCPDCDRLFNRLAHDGMFVTDLADIGRWLVATPVDHADHGQPEQTQEALLEDQAADDAVDYLEKMETVLAILTDPAQIDPLTLVEANALRDQARCYATLAGAALIANNISHFIMQAVQGQTFTLGNLARGLFETTQQPSGSAIQGALAGRRGGGR